MQRRHLRESQIGLHVLICALTGQERIKQA